MVRVGGPVVGPSRRSDDLVFTLRSVPVIGYGPAQQGNLDHIVRFWSVSA